MDYYQILEVSRDANIPTIKRKYKELAQKWHPSLHADKKQEAITKYREVTEAYEVLSNAKYKTIYDKYGISGLKKGAPNERGEIVGGDYQFTSDPDEVFRDTFGRNPFTEFFDFSTITPSEANGIFNEFSQMSVAAPKNDLVCTLEELYSGVSKRVEYEKQALGEDGITTTKTTETTTIKIQKGMREGDEIIFSGCGNVSQNEIQGDVIFRLKQKPHDRFTRDGDNLVFRTRLTLGQALLGTIIKVETLDKRVLSIPVTDIVHPTYTKVVRGEGMPISPVLPSTKDLPDAAAPPPPPPSKKKGDLVLAFDIVFPETLSEEQKQLIEEANL